ncbi:MAG TPA: bifunctional [glutamate--ammonia ligase]-adenylyl-L-tyrosine phosphorylase/[glutamate--ammonia-ligase] adenylyltransferase [Planctomycetia bacterium]|nr:bifunctional [glutamate--ammonia ligase]-adenylyl-L-tyrosine phosphorylase/[glutamate--ammonia-ligase] adenylyltransferase [Planctomycetia bacterium]
MAEYEADDELRLLGRRVHFAQPEGARANLRAMAGGDPARYSDWLHELGRFLAASADPDMALNTLERFLNAAPDREERFAFLRAQPRALLVLLQLFANSQYFGDLLVKDPTYFDFLWERGAEPLQPARLRAALWEEIGGAYSDEPKILEIVRRARHRELLRIGYRDIIVGEPLEGITRSISDLADTLVDTSLQAALRLWESRYGVPRFSGAAAASDRRVEIVALGMGKLGGRELNYSSDIDLIFIFEAEGDTDGKRSIENGEFFSGVIRDSVRYLNRSTQDGACYRVDLRLRPYGDRAPLCMPFAATLGYYDRDGRTWERQALVKARPIAGSVELGERFLQQVESFVYRRYLSFVEINELKAMKRRIERNTQAAGRDSLDLKTGRGGIRDTEFTLQFLQLNYGGLRPELRDRNTLAGIAKLAECGFINPAEQSDLEGAYRFLRKGEHRVQFLYDLQKHAIPEDPKELDKLAIRMGFAPGDDVGPGAQFLEVLADLTEHNRSIQRRLMHNLFGDEAAGDPVAEPVADLMLDPDPSPERIAQVLGPYGFQDFKRAYSNLAQLAREEIAFLSSLRCRHFLAAVAPQLLQEIAKAPDPDMALNNLETVTRSLGAKGVLWESFSSNPPLLRMYVHLCAWSQFLSDILIGNPGMIDDLLDSLVFNRAPSLAELETELSGLMRGARDVDPILHSFRNANLLSIGLQDVLGKADIKQTSQQLSQLAEVIIRQIAVAHEKTLIGQYGLPRLARSPEAHSRAAILGLGKFGGGELGYHSDLDLVLLYEGDGQPAGGPTGAESVDNFHFYTELAQRVVRTAGRIGPLGRLYPVDLRLRPTGGSGALVLPLDKFAAYYSPGGGAQTWEFQALCRARVVCGDPEFGAAVAAAVRAALVSFPWRPEVAEEIAGMRKRLEASRDAGDLKRGTGGLVDVEFAVQLVQLKRGGRHPAILEPNVWKALGAIAEAGLWGAPRIAIFREGYTFLRRIESRLRIVYNVAREDLPDDPRDLRKLAVRIGGYDGPDADRALLADLKRRHAAIRREYLEVVAEERASP